jgi:hypothetical protein
MCVRVFLLTETFISAKYVISGEYEEYQPPYHLELMLSCQSHLLTSTHVIILPPRCAHAWTLILHLWAEAVEANTGHIERLYSKNHKTTL